MDIRAGAPEAKAGREWGLPASMVLVQLFMAGMIVLSKVSIAGGMFIFALLAYRGLLGAAFVVPFALGYERGKWREMDWHATGWIFLNALIGYTMPMSLYYYGLRDTTPSYAAIFMNISPLLTFILSLILRMETLQIRSIVGSLKIVGIMLSIGGTMLISLYKGKILHLWDPILEHHHRELTTKVAGNQLRGTIFLAGSSFTFSCWYLTQSKVLKVYPYKYWSTMATCLAGGFQTTLVGIILSRDKNTWKLGWDLNLVTILYSGVLATAGRYCMTLWVVSKRGPTYPPMFNPLSVVFTILLDSIFIGDEITVGSLVGTAMAIVGLYIFIWGKSKEVNEK
ncbi:WAT1-related protein At5g64700-like isoform X1 [Triticum dicoccoides]|uniref:WAT1-related protein At5g64700-like isoform X1 n=1 Tax=Triticum dicoccoides TaxID=85692 RepID=UPI000E7A6914|nr:WAT1-related protein At5g64700-like isoform X1 [Triticum dicoccoides]